MMDTNNGRLENKLDNLVAAEKIERFKKMMIVDANDNLCVAAAIIVFFHYQANINIKIDYFYRAIKIRNKNCPITFTRFEELKDIHSELMLCVTTASYVAHYRIDKVRFFMNIKREFHSTSC